MKCPICGAKMVNKQICPYCKITDEQVLGASNKKVKEYRKSGNTDMIHYTTHLPSDVKLWKIIVYTFFFGWLGINHLYVNRPIRGCFSLFSTLGTLLVMIIDYFYFGSNNNSILFNIIYEIILYSMAINVVLWATNMIAVIFKSFKVPVVLPKKGEKL